MGRILKAFELCGDYNDQSFKLKKSNVVWECITYRDSCDKCLITRVVEEGGENWFFGLRVKKRYIDPETLVEIIDERDD